MGFTLERTKNLFPLICIQWYWASCFIGFKICLKTLAAHNYYTSWIGICSICFPSTKRTNRTIQHCGKIPRNSFCNSLSINYAINISKQKNNIFPFAFVIFQITLSMLSYAFFLLLSALSYYCNHHALVGGFCRQPYTTRLVRRPAI